MSRRVIWGRSASPSHSRTSPWSGQEGWHSGWSNTTDQLARSSVLVPDLSGAIVQAGVVPMRKGCALQDPLPSVTTGRRGSFFWDIDYAGLAMTRYSPEERSFLRPL